MDHDLEKLSPFELSLYLEKEIQSNEEKRELLNVGRGNPNWTAPVPREAFFLLGQFAVGETMIETNEHTARMIKKAMVVRKYFFIF